MTDEFDLSLIEDALGEEGLDENTKRMLEAYNFRVEIAQSFLQTFSTEPGKIVLNHLIRTTVMTPTVIEGQDAFAQGIREGEKRVVFLILEAMNRAKSGDYNVD